MSFVVEGKINILFYSILGTLQIGTHRHATVYSLKHDGVYSECVEEGEMIATVTKCRIH
jgi:hypothetical protein